MERFLLGIDVGTTNTKTALFSDERGLLSIGKASYPLSTPARDCCEQDAEALWTAAVSTVREACRGLRGTVSAISLSLQGGTLIPTDCGFRPLRPAIVWSDTRCREEAELLRSTLGADYVYQKTGWELENGLMLLQIAWLRAHEPELYAKTAYFLSVPDFISARLTGIPALDLSDAGINQLADIRKGCYDPELLSFCGVREEQLGRLVPTGQIIGHLTEAAAEELGLTTDTVLVAGAHDQYAVASGAGAFRDGDILIGSGTAWVVTSLSSDWNFRNGFSQSVSGTEGLKGALNSLSCGGSCLEWLRGSLTDRLTGEKPSYAELDEGAARKQPGCGGLLFYPYFAGSPYPLGNPEAKAFFFGLGLSHDRFDLARAVMEGVVFQTVWMLDGFRDRKELGGIKLAGGASKSRVWTQILADVSGLTVTVPEIPDLACVGAALFAGLGAGAFRSPEEGYAKLRVPERTVEPDPAASAAYAPIFEKYKKLALAANHLYTAEE